MTTFPTWANGRSGGTPILAEKLTQIGDYINQQDTTLQTAINSLPAGWSYQGLYNSGTTYSKGQAVDDSGKLYASNINNNTGNAPHTHNTGDGSGTQWTPLIPSSVGIVSSEIPTYYVRPTGSDSANGLSPGSAFATFAHAITVAQANGSGHIKLGVGTAIYTDPFDITMSKLRISGIPGLTKLQPSGASDGRFSINFNFSAAQVTDVHLDNLIFDFTSSPIATLLFSSVLDWSVHNVKILGGGYAFSMGGSQAPAQRGHVTKLTILGPFTPGRVLIAPVNVDDVLIDGFTLIGQGGTDAANIGAIDAETNTQTDSLRGLRIKNGYIQNLGYTILQQGAATDPDRLEGVQYVGNTHVDCDQMSCSIPKAVVEDNTYIWTKRSYDLGYVPPFALFAGADRVPFMRADGMRIRNNKAKGMGATGSSAFILSGTCHTEFAGNHSEDSNNPPKTNYVVEEQPSRVASILSGFSASPPSGMTIAIASGVGQQANGGTIVSVSGSTKTIAAASAYDRVDTIAVDTTTFVVSVIQGTNNGNSGLGVKPAPSIQASSNAMPLYFVYVPTGAVSIAAADVRDVRPFQTNHNKIDQDPPGIAPLQGTAKLIGASSYRAARRRPVISDPYTQSVLTDNPSIYLPMLEASGPIAQDIGANDDPANYVGGVLLNQPIGVTGRSGAKFDGTTGFGQFARPKSMVDKPLCQAPFTLEAQILPTTISGNYYVIQQGFSTSLDFKLWMANSGTLYTVIGNSGNLASSGAMSATTIQHVAVDYDGTDQKLYINGVLDSTHTPGAITYAFNSTYSYWPILLASDTGGAVLPPTPGWPGWIRHLAIWQGTNIGPTRIGVHAGLM